MNKIQSRRKWKRGGQEKEAGVNNEEPATAVTRPAVCELGCQISGTGLLLPPQEKQVMTRLSLGVFV